ncbi:MAG TPA: ATPase, T2SS/T4P/T4SS family [Tepidisphaeraceae bacterium]|jgi:type IV pilus assembly protein PilB|nr:ATPase, T2SS/T4P/T4SS family [Tepidisphaeraceae bacterium]
MFARKTTTSAGPGAIAPHERLDEPLPELDMLWQPVSAAPSHNIEGLLLQSGHVTEAQLTQARMMAAQTPGKSLAHVLLSMRVADEAVILSAVARSLDLPFEQPDPQQIDPEAFALLPPHYIQKHLVAPFRFDAGRLVIGIVDPNNVFLLDEVRRKTGKPLKTTVTTPAHILRLIAHATAHANGSQVNQIIKDATTGESLAGDDATGDGADLEKLGSESPIIRFVNHLISEGIRQGASDIHIEPKETALRIRYRIDGLLFDALSPPAVMQAAVTSRLKIMANLDISERRLPQDGRIRTVIQGRAVDLRLSTLPTHCGEKCVMRILDNRSVNVSLDDLGFSENALTIWKNQIAQPHGILLVTGPTGSGKTTTLYSSLRSMDANRLNISTVEDPIEHDLPSTTQVQVHEKIGMTFSAALRAMLRQDPDVVMIGEIRDQDTAAIAVQAALTGHLVLSTLHTNDAPSSVTRLINVGVEPYLISSAVNAIMAQRLVRKICMECREEYAPTPDMQEFLTMQGFTAQACYRGRGCDRCRRTGYSGRLGIYELLVMDDALRDLVTRNPDVNHLRRLCRERGLVTLRDDGFQKVMAGLTTVDEIIRVTESAS